MNIDGLKNGIVIDHITCGKAMQLYSMLGLDSLDCSVALIRNVQSKKMGRKDIIKIDADLDINFDVVGLLSPNATINVIKDGRTVEKKHIDLPEKVEGIVKCKNPRCITTTEPGIEHTFLLTNREKVEYRCLYCDTKAELNTL